jgi:hypothetical protein
MFVGRLCLASGVAARCWNEKSVVPAVAAVIMRHGLKEGPGIGSTGADSLGILSTFSPEAGPPSRKRETGPVVHHGSDLRNIKPPPTRASSPWSP